MTSSNEIFERARLSRDARFDGRFFVGVRTTGIYCRPICPANAPKSENVTFYRTAAAAGEAGFRPCLRCRPECAPGTPAWAGTSTTVQRGLRLIAEGALDDGSLENLAERLGVTSRHLRRLFSKHLGASPLAVAHTQRLHFAKNLIDQTSLSMRDISVAAGFGSVRRFNDTFRKTYGRTPGELRRRRAATVMASALSVQLAYRAPFDWDRLLAFFAARATPGVEQVRDGRYLRTISIGTAHGVVEVRNAGDHLLLSLHGIGTTALFSIVQRVRSLFDLDAATDDIAAVLSVDPVLKRLLKKNPGVRVPGSWDGFELAVRAILGQQVSVSAATTLAGRIAKRYGERIDVSIDGLPDTPNRLFPAPQKLVRARLENLGIIGSRARTIRSVASAVVDGTLCFDAAVAPDSFCETFKSIKGVGDWTAQYVAMRALKDPDAFPASDLGLLRAFDTAETERMKPAELLRRAEAWRPWRAYAALLLWGSDAGAGG
ncbi:MAG: helix-turn-helix domain-containing protein [Gammaproteobacteria bacterium]|nr:helix-turn-helix domain-containing protein [Gammaproteobacteria bacterium]NNC55961.1 DNA-3-methyladenine glycosylase 2 family protein [Woeseiaceae bacterium]